VEGYVFLPSFEPSISSAEVVNSVGAGIHTPGLAAIQILVPKQRSESPPNIYSGNYGLDEFPLHTDLAHWFLPPRYLMLRCIATGNDVATRLLDRRVIIDAVGESALRTTLVQPRRPIELRRPLLNLLDRHAEEQVFRWDQLFLVPATKSSGETYQKVATQLARHPAKSFFLRDPGDTLIIDNWRMLHGRSRVASENMGRRVERAYMGSLQ
jgi:alpha-ketoglutarate-dependent taurine dioxygenase